MHGHIEKKSTDINNYGNYKSYDNMPDIPYWQAPEPFLGENSTNFPAEDDDIMTHVITTTCR